MGIDLGFDRIIRDLSGARWILSQLTEGDTAATSIHRDFRRVVWCEANWVDRSIMLLVLPLLPFLIIILTTVFTALNGYAIKNGRGKELSGKFMNKSVCLS